MNRNRDLVPCNHVLIEVLDQTLRSMENLDDALVTLMVEQLLWLKREHVHCMLALEAANDDSCITYEYSRCKRPKVVRVSEPEILAGQQVPKEPFVNRRNKEKINDYADSAWSVAERLFNHASLTHYVQCRFSLLLKVVNSRWLSLHKSYPALIQRLFLVSDVLYKAAMLHGQPISERESLRTSIGALVRANQIKKGVYAN